MNIVICDDVLEDGKKTELFLHRYYQKRNLAVPEISIVKNGKELRLQKQIDLLFLDIELKNEDGVELAAEINQTSPNTMVIFVSSYPIYVTATYTVKAAQFFVKPLREDIFEKEYARILQRYEASQKQFIRKVNGEELVLRQEEVVYFRSDKRELLVYMNDKSCQSYYGKIGDEEIFFEGTPIIRCHRSYLVNLAYVQGINHDEITVRFSDHSEEKIPIGDTWRGSVRNLFLQYINK